MPSGDPVALRTCPPWCMRSQHFTADLAIDPDDGYHHYGPQIAIPHRRPDASE